MERERIQVTRHVSLGARRFIGWLFSMGYLKLSFWMGLLAIVIRPHVPGSDFAAGS